VLCDVYPLRFKGRKLPSEEVKAWGRRGWLELGERTDGAPVRIAVLRSLGGGVAGELNCASVSRITREGLMVTGWEMPERHRQAWWCVPVLAQE
jgi:hypothetical protein